MYVKINSCTYLFRWSHNWYRLLYKKINTLPQVIRTQLTLLSKINASFENENKLFLR